MKKFRVLLFLVMVLVLLTCTTSALATDFFIKLDGITGESEDPDHIGWIEALSFSSGSSNMNEIPEHPDGKGILDTFVFTHLVDKATPAIQTACMNGTVIPGGVVEFDRIIDGKLQKVYELTLSDITVQDATIKTEDLPDDEFQIVEIVELLVDKVTWKAYPDNGNGTLPKTGDQVPILLYVLLAAGSCVCAAVLRKDGGWRSGAAQG